MAPQLNISGQPQAHPPPTPYGADEIWAAECLLMLAHGFRLPPSSSSKAKSPTPSARLKIIQDSSRPPLPYVCDMCPMSFNSYQALGGHKTCHRPKAAASTPRSLTDHHDCSECSMSFSTGQALGGHKRKHYKGVIVTSSKTKSRKISSDDIGVTVEGGGPRHAGMGFDFDLNLPYIPNDDDIQLL